MLKNEHLAHARLAHLVKLAKVPKKKQLKHSSPENSAQFQVQNIINDRKLDISAVYLKQHFNMLCE